MKKFILLCSFGVSLQASISEASVLLDFEGLGNYASINNFYNGGTDSLGNSGVNYGVQFGNNALAIIDSDAAGGSGNFANEPSASTILFFLNGSAILNYGAGFDTSLSFFYSSSTAASVYIWDGLDATGNLLATLNLLPQNNQNCSGDPTGIYCNWTEVNTSFAGIAKSVDFGGTVNKVGYDNITLGSTTSSVPEPATLALLGFGFAGMGYIQRRRKSV